MRYKRLKGDVIQCETSYKRVFPFISMITWSTIQSMRNVARAEARRSGKSRLSLYLDMIKSRRRFGATTTDYLEFGFSMQDDSLKSEYITSHMLTALKPAVNGKESPLEDKWVGYQRLRAFYKRDCVSLTESSEEEIQDFLDRHPVFFAKDVTGRCGHQVVYIEQERKEPGVANHLRDSGLTMLEEAIVQHPDVARFSVHSVNTLRIVTFANDSGDLVFLPPVMRVSSDTSRTDNHYGLFLLLLDDDGIVRSDGYFQPYPGTKYGYDLLVPEHPLTGFSPKGSRVPYFKEALDQIRKMAELVPELKMIGWDIAMTPEGPDLVEFNDDPGIDLHQNYYFADIYGKPHAGIRRLAEHVFGVVFQPDLSIRQAKADATSSDVL
jgi:hypothetical protein